MASELKDQIRSAAIAYRGYNITNLGRTRELLQHDAYGPLVANFLREAGEVCSDLAGKKADLIGRVRRNRETSLRSYADAIALIVAMEMCQVRLLEEFHDIRLSEAKLAFGYSLGEISAVACGGSLEMTNVLQVPLSMAKDSAELARDVTMGVVFSRGPALIEDEVIRICLEISAQGKGTVGISAILSPNTFLILGQGKTLKQFKKIMSESLNRRVHMRVNDHHWPPLHSPIVWQHNIPSRAALMMQTLPGGFATPKPTVISLGTPQTHYKDTNARELLYRWVDHPQRLWDVMDQTLSAGVETIIHIGPEPNLIPATFRRLSENIKQQVSGRSLGSIGLRAMSGMASRPWLASLLPSRTSLLRAPKISHIMLEDWLLENSPE